MTRLSRPPRPLALGVASVALVLLLAGFTLGVRSGSSATETFHALDTGLCPFRFAVDVTRKTRTSRVGANLVQVTGPTTIRLRNASTGKVVTLEASGRASLNKATGSLTFSGHQIWLSAEGHVPYLSTDGPGRQLAPTFVTSGADLHPRVIDPCALLAKTPPTTAPVASPAPWALPAFALSQIAYAGLTPVSGALIRHDHVHLDLFVNGHRLTIPAGLGQVEPVDFGLGRCPPPPEKLPGDCEPGHFFAARVALSPLHAHSASGIVHIEADRPGTFTLGQLFDEWGVRFTSRCLGGYCTGGGRELRVVVNGKRVPGEVRKVALTDLQEIAVVFGGPGDFDAVPSAYTGRMPVGCGGAGEHSCFS